jgi:hypothetical protein
MNSSGARNAGNYFLGVDFRPQAVALQTLAQSQLSSAQPKQMTSFTVDMSSVFHFVLSADAAGASGVGVMMTIYDEAGNVVYSLGAGAGMPVSGDVYLKKGTYRVRILAGTFDGQPLPNVNYTLRYLRTTDNNGPEPIDPTANPSGPPPQPGGTGTTSDSGQSGVAPQDPYSDPYTTEDQQSWFYYWDASNSSGSTQSQSTPPPGYYA